MKRLAATVGVLCLAGVLGLAVLPLIAAGSPAPPSGQQPASTRPIRARLAGLYYAATQQRCPELDWTLLAAVGHVESGHAAGRTITDDGIVTPPIVGLPLDGTDDRRRIPDTDDGRLDGDTRWDRAVGPMQFIPTTWQQAGLDASGDGTADPHNATDAVHTAAAHLCDLTHDQPLRAALRSYNDSTAYVSQVLATADRYRNRYAATQGRAQDLLGHPNLSLTPAAATDIRTGRVAPRLLDLLAAIASRTRVGVSVIKTGHSRFVAGTTRTSLHWCGRALDLYAVADQPVTAGNITARQLVAWLASLPDHRRPTEVGSPWPDHNDMPGFFSDQRHSDHLHVAIGGPCSG